MTDTGREGTSPAGPEQSGRATLVDAAALGLLALAVRLVHLAQSASGPAFRIPLVDAESYHRLATALADGQPLTDALFWQPLFYPGYLAIVYSLAGPSVVAAKLSQAVLGVLTVLLTYRLGRQVFGLAAGRIAAGILAVYGPLVFFEVELLATGWAAFWTVTLVLQSIAAGRDPGPLRLAALGASGALSALTRPTFLPFVAAIGVWLVVVWRRDGSAWRPIGAWLGSAGIAFALLTGPAAWLSHGVSGRLSFLPASGGINLWVGNNPDAEETIVLRPGSQWRELTRAPRLEGVERKQDTPAYFRGRVLGYVRDQPLAFAGGLVDKTVQFFSSRELPRNVDLYVFRQWSSLLHVLVWKLGSFGFPFGALLPLALAGLALRPRKIPAPLLLFLVLYPAAIVLVFVSARYRAPVVPALAVLAAGGVIGLLDLWRRRSYAKLLTTGAGCLAIAALATLPGPFPAERIDYEAETFYLLGQSARASGQESRAVEWLERAVNLDPGHSDAHNTLGTIYTKRRDLPAARSHLRSAVTANPRSVIARDNLARVLAALGERESAAVEFRAALEIEPYNAEVLSRYGALLASLGQHDDAVASLREAVRLAPLDRTAVLRLGAALVGAGRGDEAVQHYRRSLAVARSAGHERLTAELERRLGALGAEP